MTFFVNIKFDLCAVKLYRAVLESLLAHDFGKVVERSYFLHIIPFACLDDFLSLLIGIAAVTAYDCAAYAAVEDTCGRVHLKYA